MMQRASPLAFFVLVFALSIPLWAIGGATGLRLRDGLPLSALQVFSPAIAAGIAARLGARTGAGWRLLGRALDVGGVARASGYAAAALLVPPGIMVVSYAVMRAAGTPLPEPRLPIGAAPLLVAAFSVPAVAEEVGWSGFALERLRERRSALEASVIVGAVWASWHVVPLVQAHRSAGWIAWKCLETVAARVLVSWIYENTGRSVLAAAAFHAVSNASWLMFPNGGSHYSPTVTGLVTAAAALAVVAGWGPTLKERRTWHGEALELGRIGGGADHRP